jgi:hypothetical protein
MRVAKQNPSSQRMMWQQPSLFTDAIELDTPPRTSLEERGAIFTRPEVVDFILDLVGYTPSRPLHRLRLLEPAIGQGDFLFPAVDRLLVAWRAEAGGEDRFSALQAAIRGVELHAATFEATRAKLIDRLHGHGFSRTDA